MFLYQETANTSMAGAGVSIYDPSTAPRGAVTFDQITEHLAGRLPLARVFRQRLARVPLDLDHPYWIEDPDFDLDFHIRETAVPPPGGARQLGEQIARITARPLDRSRPLWELYLVHGLEGGKVGILTKIHHSAVDGS